MSTPFSSTPLPERREFPQRPWSAWSTCATPFTIMLWSEVWIGEWISVDSVLNQFPADATHIKFLEGEIDRQMDILQLIGNLKISIIEAS